MQWSEEEILKHVRSIVAETLRLSPEEVKSDAALVEELGAESLDFVDMVFRIESEFKVRFYEGGLIEKLSTVFGPDALSQEDRLTDLGAKVLRLRMPEIDPSEIDPGMPLVRIQALYTPATWARAVKELINARPRACSNCRSRDLKPTNPSVLLCPTCNTEVSTPTQEELIEAWATRISKSFKLIDA